MPKPPAPTASSPFVDVFKAMAWEWRDLAEQRDRLRDEWDRCSADVEVEVARLDEAHSEHPVLHACRRLDDLTGIPRSDWEEAAWRINSTVGLDLFVPQRAGGRVRPRRDLRHLLRVLMDLHQSGATTPLRDEMCEACSHLLASPAASTRSARAMPSAARRTKDSAAQTPPSDPPTGSNPPSSQNLGAYPVYVVNPEEVGGAVAAAFRAGASTPSQEQTPPARSPGAPSNHAQPRLQIKDGAVWLDGERVHLDMTDEARGAALCLLGHLLAANGDWRSSTDLDDMEEAGACRQHSGVRWDRVRKTLPPCLFDLIESNRRKGYRLKPAVWHR
jgi:hypothetical protein